ncbi:MAG: DUF3793 family protein [Desulfuromonadales bacterium]
MASTLRTDRGKKPVPPWQKIAPRFTSEKDCLASFIAYETAEIIDRVKPGNLINLSDRCLPCGRNMFRSWKKYGPLLLSRTGLELKVLRTREDNMLLFIFRRSDLQSLIERRPVRALLNKAGYPAGEDLDTVLGQLGSRMSESCFPHEIGLFLGYPLKDVAAFMGLASLPFTCQGPWKIYGNPHKSLHLAGCHRSSRCRMAQRLSRTTCPQMCLLRRPPGYSASIYAA